MGTVPPKKKGGTGEWPHVHMYTIQNNAKLMLHAEEYHGQLLTQN